MKLEKSFSIHILVDIQTEDESSSEKDEGEMALQDTKLFFFLAQVYFFIKIYLFYGVYFSHVSSLFPKAQSNYH